MPPTDYKPKVAAGERPKYTRDAFSSGDFLYPGKIIFNEVTISQSQGKAAGCHQWEQHIEQGHKVYSDGNPARQIQSLLLQNPNTKETIWEGSDADQIAQAYEELCGCDLLPDNPDSADFLNHWFMFKSVKVPGTERVGDDGKERALYRQVPTEYLGADYKYDKELTVIGGGDGAAPAAAPEEDPAGVAAVVAVLDGMTEEDVRGGAMLEAVKNDAQFEAGGIKTVLGLSVRGGFVPPKAILLTKLVDAGEVHIEDGVVKAGGE